MDPLQVAAQFAAYTWLQECSHRKTSSAEATHFAHNNWQAFSRQDQRGLGQLLIRIGRLNKKPRAARIELMHTH